MWEIFWEIHIYIYIYIEALTSWLLHWIIFTTIIIFRWFISFWRQKIQVELSKGFKSILLKKAEERRKCIKIHWCQTTMSSFYFWKRHKNHVIIHHSILWGTILLWITDGNNIQIKSKSRTLGLSLERSMLSFDSQNISGRKM